MAWRTKKMAHDEWTGLQDGYEDLFTALAGPREMALFIRRDPDEQDKHIVLIPGHRSNLVEVLSPGGWEDCQNQKDHKWILLVGHGDAPEEWGIQLGSET